MLSTPQAQPVVNNASSERSIRLTTSDSNSFTVPLNVVKSSETVLDYIQTVDSKKELEFSVPHVTAPILEFGKTLRYL
jgi:hypothetical protein